MSKTSVSTNLLESLQVLAELVLEGVGEDLRVLSVNDIVLAIEKPGGDLVLSGILDDGDDTLKLFGGELTGAGHIG
jgi:hypothetical protein